MQRASFSHDAACMMVSGVKCFDQDMSLHRIRDVSISPKNVVCFRLTDHA